MSLYDYLIIIGYLLGTIGIGIYLWQQSANLKDYFLAGRKLPFYLSGISMVATTFAADTPLAVTGIVAKDGIAGNWLWWSLAFSGLLTTFFFADLWRRSEVMTDAEFCLLRYGERHGRLLQKLRAFYQGIIVNTLIMAWVTTGMHKVLSIAFGLEKPIYLFFLYVITVFYILFSGLRAVVLLDFVQFWVAMAGSILLAYMAVEACGGLNLLREKLLEANLSSKLVFFPGPQDELFLVVLFYLGVPWWASSYPGAEPGGGSYVAQRLFSSKDEKHALWAALLFNYSHYVLRAWPWILTALAGLILLPPLKDGEEIYPLLMKKLMPPGLLGVMALVFISAFMSTISTHLNLGSSYLVNDLILPLWAPRSQHHQLILGALSTIILATIAFLLSLYFSTVREVWEFVLLLGAGSGPVFILRWFWWRIHAYCEIVAMLCSFLVGLSLKLWGGVNFMSSMLINVTLTTLCWFIITLVVRPCDCLSVEHFFKKVQPGGLWGPFEQYRKIPYQARKRFLAYLLSLAGLLGLQVFLHWLFVK
ncbi:MAG: Na+:solute symporter [Leptospiraceae bacterium]|nr:Na+:solute symporter [Leptospiraceae bacterium]MDW8307064.1 sodium:solute symporter family protein [Leptospiraceae bacterium]